MVRDGATHRRRAVPILQVAGSITAVIRLGIQRVVIVDVAGRAGSRRRRHVHAGQGEAGDRVIEGRHVGPGDGVVAIGAVVCSKCGPGCGMNGVIGLLPVAHMAAVLTVTRA